MTGTYRPLRLTSLLAVEERLLEAEHFAKRMGRERDEAFGYDLSAFVTSARSVTFLLQKEFSKVAGFPEWMATERAVLAEDPAARFFLKMRNYSEKEGRISLVGVALNPSMPGRRSRWSHRFAGTSEPVPSVLLNRDVVDCCREHLAKLAKLVLRFSDQFPFHSCPGRALTPEGIQALNIDLDDAFAALGYPREWTKAAPNRDTGDFIRVLARQVDAVNFEAIRRISRLEPRKRPAASEDEFHERLATSMVAGLEGRRDDRSTLGEFLATELLRRDAGGTR